MELQIFDAAACDDCSFAHTRTHIVADEIGDNYAPGGVMVIGEAGGWNEDKSGRPFVGDSGQVLNGMLDAAGLDRADLYITNTIRCFPGRDHKFTKAEIAQHSPFVEAALADAQPLVILAIGATALRWFDSTRTLTSSHGKPFHWRNSIVIPMFHPAYAMRNQAIWEPLYRDFCNLADLPEPATAGYYTLGNDLQAYLMAHLEGRIGFDLETTDDRREGVFYPHEQTILGYSVAYRPGFAIYVPEPPGPYMTKVLEDPDIIKVCHNAKFEYQLLQNHGITLRGYEDTKLKANLLGHLSTRLKDLSWQVLNFKQLELDDVLDGRSTRDLTPEEWLPYAAPDADMTLQLDDVFTADLEREGLTQLYYEFELPLIPLLAAAERHGVLLDSTALGDLGLELHMKRDRLGHELKKFFGDINLNSGPQKKAVIFDAWGIKPLSRTAKTKEPQLDKNFFEAKRGEHVALPMLEEYGKLGDLLSDFVDKLPRMVDAAGLLHPSINQAGTWEEAPGSKSKEPPATGRFSGSNPNIMQIPKRDRAMAVRVRRAFRAQSGYVLLSVDVGQEEARLAAAISGDAQLISDFEGGIDVYIPIAEMLKGSPLTSKDELDPHGKAWRDASKIVFLLRQYGGGPQKAETVHPSLTISRASGIIGWLDDRYPQWSRFSESIEAELNETGYVTTMFGRRRRLPGIWVRNQHAEAVRMGVSHPIQGTGADILKSCIIRLFGGGGALLPYDASFLFPVHDELVLEVWKPHIKEVVEIVRHMTDWFEAITLPVEVAVGESWGDMVKV